MAGPIVFISHYRVRTGGRAELGAAFAQVKAFIEATKPRTALFGAFADPNSTQVAFVHAFADPDAMTLHFEGAAERSRAASDLITPLRYEIFGAAPAASVEELRLEADTTGATLEVHDDPLGGFLRGSA